MRTCLTLVLVTGTALSTAIAQDPTVSPPATSTAPQDNRLHLRFAVFDPLTEQPPLPAGFTADGANRLFVVQFASTLCSEHRDALRRLGAEVHTYLPSRAYLARMEPEVAARAARLEAVRWVGPYHPAYRVDPLVIDDITSASATAAQRYNLVPVDYRADAGRLEGFIESIGGTIDMPADGGSLVTATLTPAQLIQVSQHDTVLWIDRWTPLEPDMDNARLQSGTETLQGLAMPVDGKGMRVHSFDIGFSLDHPEFAARPPYRTAPIVVLGAGNDSHGSSVIGILAAQGLSAQAKGMMPFAQLLVTGFSQGINNRYALARTLRDPSGPYHAMSSTSSVSSSRSLSYTAVSADTDRWIFDFDIFYTQSQSNAGSRQSRPEAWAKNTASVSGFNHFNNTDPSDDVFASGSSRGPASDGRLGVTFCGYYDSIFTTTSNGNYTEFCCTSGATPMVNGLAGLIIEMFTDGDFGYPGVSWEHRFDALPHFTTTKVIAMATTRPMPPNRATRVQQGWGFPNVLDAYNLRDKMLVLDEEDVLAQGQQRAYYVFSPGGQEFRAAMTYADPPAAPSASIHRINSLDLSVTAPDGTLFWGNHGLDTGAFSTPGGGANDRDTEENVWIEQAQRGVHVVAVRAEVVRQDGHVETAATDADFALAVRGITGGRDKSGMSLDLISSQPGEFKVAVANVPATGWASGWTAFSASTDRHPSLGNLFGVEVDNLTLAVLSSTPAAGSVLAFTNSGTGSYPRAGYTFPTGLALALQGVTLDAVVILADAQGKVADVSSVDRVVVQ